MRAEIVGLGRVGYDFGLDKNRPQPASHFHCYQKLGAELAVCDTDQLKIEIAASEILGRMVLPF